VNAVSTERLCDSVEETEAAAAELAGALRPGACIALHGELAAGKTQFVRGLVRGLGGDGRTVSSPTFVLLHVYQTPRLTVYHLDAYRVRGDEDFESIGFSELLEQGGVTVVEWAGRVENLLPPDRIEVQIEAVGPTSRLIRISQRDKSARDL
jgi:tRNA threonylcarbamoyladenosine biosynthesis protein TsaE